ncbi:thiaminase II [Rubrobacter taiwanensis]|uniref:Aminopyrimidine aminohydrolase n=1 Tax=Rubrobacter taiwanensis TaxID=185139 RepID=A0A4R1BQQ2_9ACTN|nr:thiaminase II [Rubrobacter taiwanensis]TCJ20030.1 thiaminase II [Rubrobacter taiwanensis]
MKFTDELRQKADPIYEAIFGHPFVRGIAGGSLSGEQLAHYVRQDFQYLTVFCQVYGLAISKSTRREDIEFFNEQIRFILDSENHPHRNFAAVSGHSMKELEQAATLTPTARNYTRHMLYAAHSGTLGELLCALYPCPLTYWEIGLRLKEEVRPDDSHPFREWIEFYADPVVGDICREFASRIDRLAADAGAAERARMEDHYLTSCRMEYMFWSMAYDLEGWPV